MGEMILLRCSPHLKLSFTLFHASALELYKEFQEEAYSIALHPSGLYVLVGFSSKLCLMNLLIDDIRTFKEFTVRACREVSNASQWHKCKEVSHVIYK